MEPNVKLECVSRFCYLGDMLSAGGGVRVRVRCASGPRSQGVVLHESVVTVWCILSYKGQDIQSMRPECVNLWD